MNTKEEINECIDSALYDSKTCKLIDDSEIDLLDINNEINKKNQWFKENDNMLTSIQNIILEYRDLVHEYNTETENLFNISKNINILEEYKNSNEVAILPTYHAFGFLLSNEYESTSHDKYPNISNDVSDKLREKLYNEKETCCGAELSKQEYNAKNEIIKEKTKKFTQFYNVLSINEDIFKNFSKEDFKSFIDLQISSFKIVFKYQKNKCENIKKKLNKYRDSVVSISDDYEKLIGFLKSTNFDIKELLKSDSMYNKKKDD